MRDGRRALSVLVRVRASSCSRIFCPTIPALPSKFETLAHRLSCKGQPLSLQFSCPKTDWQRRETTACFEHMRLSRPPLDVRLGSCRKHVHFVTYIACSQSDMQIGERKRTYQNPVKTPVRVAKRPPLHQIQLSYKERPGGFFFFFKKKGIRDGQRRVC